MNFKGLQKVSTISERLQIAMDKRKIKQIDLARVADVNQGALSRYLKGSYEPKSATIYKLALALDVSDMWLEGYDVPMERSRKQKEIDFKNNLYRKIAQDMDLLKTISQYYNLPEEKQKTIRDLVDQMSR
ncbi:MAG: helix-turn-helix domain-containing protein [Mogibacterium sp.]|uniref:helix-turn-helix domain-containing protein n=1 Tax=Mogibacterium sp. TaxID=2049035 RepID=UPI001A4EDCEA|nr:helix-turn-helix domain-containing protein [Mogibacterium sp.]MBL6469358.1 helix-turn-helix domain-containing protein [Mogibacterium sp.]